MRRSEVKFPESTIDGLPKNTDIRGGYDVLSLWGGKIALVEAPRYSKTAVSESEFNPSILARKYIVYGTNVEPQERFLGQTVHFRDGQAMFWETTFSFYDAQRVDRSNSGRIIKEEMAIYWVKLKLKDLMPGEHYRLARYLLDQHYAETPGRYPLTAKKWEKLLQMDFDVIQDGGDYELANAVDAVCPKAGSYCWERTPGIFSTTKNGHVKWIVSKKNDRL